MVHATYSVPASDSYCYKFCACFRLLMLLILCLIQTVISTYSVLDSDNATNSIHATKHANIMYIIYFLLTNFIFSSLPLLLPFRVSKEMRSYMSPISGSLSH